jgi:two-component system nitrogen regulation response regulator NtrX
MNPLERGTILVVDDDAKVLRTLADILKSRQFDVVTAENGRKALQIIDEGRVDAVLLDLVLGREDGLEVLRRIGGCLPGLPVIILTGHGTITKAVEAVKVGAFDFLEKPVESEKIVLALENALRRQRLEKERSALIKDALSRFRIVGVTKAMRDIEALIQRAAPSDARVLITGESGAGKELIARALHLRSSRGGEPFLVVNCAAIPEDLIESELFGHEKGAFTGATQRHEGSFKLASGGTLFLDEIGDMSLKVQAKVLRAIEDGEIRRVGGEETLRINTRIIAASNQDLRESIRKAAFREDLYFRLNVIDIHVPPLRERREDIPVLVAHFLGLLGAEKKVPIPEVDPAAMELLIGYDWPGNVRELKNLLEKALVLHPGDIMTGTRVFELLKNTSLETVKDRTNRTLSQSRKAAERESLLAKLLATGWDYDKTARELGISRATLFNKLKEYGIKRSLNS